MLYDDFRHFLENACGIVLGENKHYLVTSRLNRLTHEFSFNNLNDMLNALKSNKDSKLRERVIDAMTTNETSWFRDSYPYEILAEDILPEVAKNKLPRLRIWSAAASTGQESYSIGIVIQEFQGLHPGMLNLPIEILGTDISNTVLTAARKGIYDELSMGRGVSAERRKRFFTQASASQWLINEKIRNMVRFIELNLLQNYSQLGKFDLIFCRNVLIYFSSEIKSAILERMAQILNPGGYLILGGSETPSGYSSLYEMVRFTKGVAYRLKPRKP
ncbi:MAG: protein-glutamate O-methyltransferase CheR [Gammaproteobacteria bacterium]|nr:protein-glutamate O-methyltransferase CheR [Gammaproteobacteria bacterium]